MSYRVQITWRLRCVWMALSSWWVQLNLWVHLCGGCLLSLPVWRHELVGVCLELIPIPICVMVSSLDITMHINLVVFGEYNFNLYLNLYKKKNNNKFLLL